jgi:hypothetical protein
MSIFELFQDCCKQMERASMTRLDLAKVVEWGWASDGLGKNVLYISAEPLCLGDLAKILFLGEMLAVFS